MKLVSFEVFTDLGPMRRIGLMREAVVVDLQAAYAAHLRDEKGLWDWRRLACALVPVEMLDIENKRFCRRHGNWLLSGPICVV